MNTWSHSLRALGVTAALIANASSAHAQSTSCTNIPTDTADTRAPTGAPAPPPAVTATVATNWVSPYGYVPGYCVYTPPNTSATSGVILYLHGTRIFDPARDYSAYVPMLRWLASRGYWVVFPELPRDQSHWPALSLQALSNSLYYLKTIEGKTITRIAVAGHSMGAMAATVVAAQWPSVKSASDPSIQALIAHEPAGADYWNVLANARTLRNVRALILEAESNLGWSGYAKRIWQNLTGIPLTEGSGWSMTYRKNYLRVMSDKTHWAPLAGYGTSDHNTVQAYPLNALDYWGYWRPTEAAVREAFTGQSEWGYSAYCSATGTSGLCQTVRSMGVWSDGVAATPMQNYGELSSQLQ